MCGQVDSVKDLSSKHLLQSYKDSSVGGFTHSKILIGFQEVTHRISGGDGSLRSLWIKDDSSSSYCSDRCAGEGYGLRGLSKASGRDK